MSGDLRVERDDQVVSLILDDPPNNAISLAMVDRLQEAAGELAADDGVRVVIITGAGEKAFSVGANIKEFGVGVQKMTLEGFLRQRLDVIAAFESLGKPVIAAINGLCIGGGLELSLGCHFRIATSTARIGLPEIDLGIVPAWGGTQRLTRTVGRAHALDMMLRARKVDAEHALRIGLVHQVCEPAELANAAKALAAELAGRAPLAVQGILRAVIGGQDGTLEQGLALELEAVKRTAASRDAMEGINAFLQKRAPRFEGR
jgi:enoyl-CoA hydratase